MSLVIRKLSSRTRHRAGWIVGVVLTVGFLAAAGSADAAGAPFERGDVFFADGDGVREYSPDGQLRGTVSGTAGARVLCFDPSGDHLILPGVGVFDSSGNALPSSWASVTGAHRCVADGLGHVYVSARPAGYTITKYDLEGRLLRRFDITDPEAHVLALDLAPDGCTVYYGSWAAPRGAINRLDGCRGTQGLPPFNGDSFVDDLRVLPDGSVIVTDDTYARLANASGQFVRDYRHPTCRVAFACSDSLRTMSLDPDGRSFWVCCAGFKPDYVAETFRFDIGTGELLAEWAPSVPGGGLGGGFAVYGPPLLGDADIERTVDSNAAGTAEAFTARAGHSGQITRLSLYVDASSTAGQAVVGVYSNSGGHPGTLRTATTISGLKPGSWNTAGLPSISVAAGERYWIAVLGPRGGGSLRFRDKAGGGRSETSTRRDLTALPARWSTGAVWPSAPLSAYGG